MIFNDKSENQWDLRLNMGMLEEIDNVIPKFSTEIVKDVPKLIDLLWQDNRKVVMILWVLCEDQAIKRDISPKQFASLFDREVLDRAVDSLLGEFISFFQYGPVGMKIRQAMPELLMKLKRQVETAVSTKIQEASLKLGTVSPE